RRNIVPVAHISAAAEAAVANELERRSYRKLGIALEQAARARADEDRVVAVVPDVVDVDDRIVLIEVGRLRFPAQSQIHSQLGADLPGVLNVESEVIVTEIGDRSADLALAIAHEAKQHSRHGTVAVLAVPGEPAARHHGADLVVAQAAKLAAELRLVLAPGPGEVVLDLEAGIPVHKRTVVALADAGET